MRIRRIPLVSLVLVLAAMLAAPTPSIAATSPYGSFVITYRNRSTYAWQVREAFAVWNRAGTPYRFVAARAGTRAHITITQRPYIGSPNSSIAGVGGIGFVQLSVARLKSPKAYDNVQVKIVAHEIGHAMGLSHSANTCALMYSSVDFPGRPRCATPERQWDGRQFCGPRGIDVAVLARRHRFTPRVVAWRGYCTTPQDATKAATGPYVAGTITGEATQFPYDGAGQVQLTLTNTGNTIHGPGSYGIVAVDAAGKVLQSPWRFGIWYQAITRQAPLPGQSSTITIPPCNGQPPLVMRLRLASQNHDAFLGPVVPIRIDDADGDPTAPAGECTIDTGGETA